MTGAADLRSLQEWMSIVIQHERDAAAGARTRAARARFPVRAVNAGEVVLPNDRQGPYARLDVYNGGYFSRLKEVLESDFPAVCHALGEAAWHRVALGYVARHPSEHPNLNVFNRHLPQFLAHRNLEHRAFLRDLAQLEVHMSEAFDAPEATPADMSALAGLTDDQVAAAVFTPNPSLRLHESAFPVNRYLQMVFDGRDPPPVAAEAPIRAPSFVAVYRKEHRVWRLTLPRPMFQVLTALTEQQPLGVAVHAGGDHDEDFQHWFREWAGDGLFTAIRY